MIVALGIYFVLSSFVTRHNREWHVERQLRRAGTGGPVVAGAAFAVAWTPCVGPTLGAILRSRWARDAVAFCLQRRNLRRTTRIALVVGVVLTVINQSGVIASGHATLATWVRCALKFAVPFLVSNAGLLGGRR